MATDMSLATAGLGTYVIPDFPACNQVRKPQARLVGVVHTPAGMQPRDYGFYSGGTHLGLKGTLYELSWPMILTSKWDALYAYVKSDETITWDAAGRARRGTTTEKYIVRVARFYADPYHRLADYIRNARMVLNVRDVV